MKLRPGEISKKFWYMINIILENTERFTDLQRPNLVKFAYGGLVYNTASAASKNDNGFKSGQKRLKNSASLF